MKRLMTGTFRFIALLAMSCFVVVVVMCTVLMTTSVSDAHCSDKLALPDCLMSRMDHDAVNKFVLVNTFLLMIGGVVFVLRYKIKEIQESFLECWWRVEVLFFQGYLIELFSRGIVRSKIYEAV